MCSQRLFKYPLSHFMVCDFLWNCRPHVCVICPEPAFVQKRRLVELASKWTFGVGYLFYGPERHFWECRGVRWWWPKNNFLYPPPFFLPYKLSMMKLAWRIVLQFDIEAHLNCLKSHNDNFVDLWLFQVGIQRWVLRKFQISPCPFFLCRSGAGVAGLLLKWTFGVRYILWAWRISSGIVCRGVRSACWRSKTNLLKYPHLRFFALQT